MNTNLLELSKDITVEFKNKKAKKEWEKWEDICKNLSCAPKIFDYATAWIKCMQYLMKERKSKLNESIVLDSYNACMQVYKDLPFKIHKVIEQIINYWKYGSEFKIVGKF